MQNSAKGILQIALLLCAAQRDPLAVLAAATGIPRDKVLGTVQLEIMLHQLHAAYASYSEQ